MMTAMAIWFQAANHLFVQKEISIPMLVRNPCFFNCEGDINNNDFYHYTILHFGPIFINWQHLHVCMIVFFSVEGIGEKITPPAIHRVQRMKIKSHLQILPHTETK